MNENYASLRAAVLAAALAGTAQAAQTENLRLPVLFDQGVDAAAVVREARAAVPTLPAVPGSAVSKAAPPEGPTSPWQSAVDSCQPKPAVGNGNDFVAAYKSCFSCQLFTYLLDFQKMTVGMKCQSFPPREDDPEWRWEDRTKFTGFIYAPGHNAALTALKFYEHYWERVRRERPDRDRDRDDRRPGGGNPGDRPDRDLPERPERP